MKKHKAFSFQLSAFTLIELLVVVTIFAVLGILSTQIIILTLRGSIRSESLINVRDNLGYSLSIVERQLQNARSITDCSNQNTKVINFQDENGITTFFSCADMTGTGYIASGSARLTGGDIKVTECSFTCEEATVGGIPSVNISVTAKDANRTLLEGGQVSISTKVFLRNY